LTDDLIYPSVQQVGGPRENDPISIAPIQTITRPTGKQTHRPVEEEAGGLQSKRDSISNSCHNSGVFLAESDELHHCAEATRPSPLPGQARNDKEHQRLKKIRVVDLLEGKTARILALLVFVLIVVLIAFVMSQTG